MQLKLLVEVKLRSSYSIPRTAIDMSQAGKQTISFDFIENDTFQILAKMEGL